MLIITKCDIHKFNYRLSIRFLLIFNAVSGNIFFFIFTFFIFAVNTLHKPALSTIVLVLLRKLKELIYPLYAGECGLDCLYFHSKVLHR